MKISHLGMESLSERAKVRRVIQRWNEQTCLSVNVRAILLTFNKNAPSVEKIYERVRSTRDAAALFSEHGLEMTPVTWHEAGVAIKWFKFPALLNIKASKKNSHSYIGTDWRKDAMRLRNPFALWASMANGLLGQFVEPDAFAAGKYWVNQWYSKESILKNMNEMIRIVHPPEAEGWSKPSEKWLEQEIGSDD